jgi:hypothetical protein
MSPANPAFVPLAIVGGTTLSYGVAWLIGMPALVPILNTLPAYPFMIVSLRRGRVDEAIVRMLIWAATMAIVATALSYARTPDAGRLFVRGESYRIEMFAYLLTGSGPEGHVREFLPQHLAHAAIFCALALATGSLAAMPMGAVLMNYMAYYVGALAVASAHPVRAIALAWVPWSLIRIASFVTLGVVLAGPVLGRMFGFPYRIGDHRRWIGLALAGLALDIALKWMLAPAWRQMIRSAAGW